MTDSLGGNLPWNSARVQRVKQEARGRASSHAEEAKSLLVRNAFPGWWNFLQGNPRKVQQLAQHPTAWQLQACNYHQTRTKAVRGGVVNGEEGFPFLYFTAPLFLLRAKQTIWHACPCLEEMPLKWL